MSCTFTTDELREVARHGTDAEKEMAREILATRTERFCEDPAERESWI